MVKRKAITKHVHSALVLLAAFTRPGLAAPACQPTMIVAGDQAVVTAIDDRLHAKGIATSVEGCPAGHVDIERREGSIVLSITDADGRKANRTVEDSATAAALIESFVIVAEPPPPVRAEPSPVRVAVIEQPSLESESAVRVVHEGSSVVRGALSVTAESSIATDKSIWYGARASGCVRLGSICVGAIARYEQDSVISGDATMGPASREGAALLLAAEYTIARDGFRISPGIATGVGWLRVRRDFVDGGGDTLEIDAGGVRAEAHVAATIPLSRLVSLRVGVAVDVAPMAHTQPFKEDIREAPGEPRAFGRLELGLELRQP